MKFFQVKDGNALTNYFAVLEAKIKAKIYLRRKVFYFVLENIPQPLGRIDDPEFMFENSPYYIEIDNLTDVTRVPVNVPTLGTGMRLMQAAADATPRGTVCLYARAGVRVDHDAIVSRIVCEQWHAGKNHKTNREMVCNAKRH